MLRDEITLETGGVSYTTVGFVDGWGLPSSTLRCILIKDAEEMARLRNELQALVLNCPIANHHAGLGLGLRPMSTPLNKRELATIHVRPKIQSPSIVTPSPQLVIELSSDEE